MFSKNSENLRLHTQCSFPFRETATSGLDSTTKTIKCGQYYKLTIARGTDDTSETATVENFLPNIIANVAPSCDQIVSLTFNTGRITKGTGVIVANPVFNYTDIVELTAGTTYLIQAIAQKNIAILSLYDENDTYIGDLIRGDDRTMFRIFKPDRNMRVRITGGNYSNDHFNYAAAISLKIINLFSFPVRYFPARAFLSSPLRECS